MKAQADKIAKTLIDLEISLNERWSSGDCQGYLTTYHDSMSYFDPVSEHLLIGGDVVRKHILSMYQNPHIVRSEYIHPHVIISDAGDLAVLSYNLNNYILDDEGKEKLLRAWNSTEVYQLIDGQWRIVHSNWALTKSMTNTSAS
jgi:ketosteroid isomerase-like protein